MFIEDVVSFNADPLSLRKKRSGTRLVELHSNSEPRQVPASFESLLMNNTTFSICKCVNMQIVKKYMV